jgi:outer membrane protein OmpA-like peptidoglycan-associated protein
MRNLKLLFLFTFLCSFVIIASAQDDKYKNVRKKDYDQKDQYDDGEYLFPPQPRNNWSLGIKGGLAYVSGDVKGQPGFGGALDVRKALGHAVSLRLQVGAGRTQGQNYQETNGYRNHETPWDRLYYANNVNPFTGGTTAPYVFYNFQMTYGDAALQVLVSLNNINFYKEQVKWNVYAGAGLGLMGYTTNVDALDANGNIYNFFNEVEAIQLNDPATWAVDGRRERLNLLTTRQDGVFETPAERRSASPGLTLGNNVYTTNVFGSLCAGLRYRVSRRVELELEHRIGWANDDLLDGQQWTESGFGGGSAFDGSQTAQTRDFDSYNQTTLGLHFRLGPGEESAWWRNPLTEVYSSAQQAKDIVKKLTDDTDKDGVPDLYDKEPDTPEGIPVGLDGRTLDSDGDGYPDHEDDEPFTPKGCAVDKRGVAIDADNDGVADCFDKEPNSPPGMYYDAKGVAIQLPDPGKSQVAETPCLLPIIFFDLDKDAIKPEFYPELHYIAQLMKSDASLKVRATGHTDVRNTDAYNEDLSRRRVQNTIDFIVNTYGIERSRFLTTYEGEKKTLVKNLPDNRANAKLEPLHYVNRRVEFECVKE